MSLHSEPLHERYPMQRVRVVRGDGRVSTLSLKWPLYVALLRDTPGRNPRTLAKLLRAAVLEADAGGRVALVSAKAVRAVRAHLGTVHRGPSSA